MSKILEAALMYASWGYEIFPIVPGGKKPITAHGFHDATTSENQIEKWWSEYPNANIGLKTEGLLVLDIDGKNNPWAFSDKERLSSLVGAPVQLTPGGGSQYFFMQPDGKDWRNTQGKIGAKVDTRANGGYVVVAPSIRPDGKYEWVPSYELLGPKTTLPEPPDWLLDLCDQFNSGRRFRLQDQFDGQEEIPEGRRNGVLASLGGALRRIGLNENAINITLQTINNDRCKPKLSEKEIERIAKSISKYEPDQIATMVAEGENLAQIITDPKHPGSFDRKFCHVPGLIGRIQAYNLSTAPRPQPILALAGALALMSAITGRKITDEYGMQSNLYLIGVCPSGGGKEHARKVNKEILFKSGWEELIGPESFGSHAGIISTLSEHPTKLFQIDEIGRYLKTLVNPQKAPHLYNVITYLLRLYTTSGSVFFGDAYADTKRMKSIHWPHAVVYGTTVARSFFSGLSRENLIDGFIARLLVFESETPRPKLQRVGMSDVPQEIIKQVMAWKLLNPGKGNLSKENPNPRVLRYSIKAGDILEEFDRTCDDKYLTDPDYAALWARVPEVARKLGILWSASKHGPDVQEIQEDAILWACRLSEYLCSRLIYLADEHVGENQHEIAIKRVRSSIRDGGEQGISKWELTRKFRWLEKRRLDEIVRNLLECGDVLHESDPEQTRGRRKSVYVASIYRNNSGKNEN